MPRPRFSGPMAGRVYSADFIVGRTPLPTAAGLLPGPAAAVAVEPPFTRRELVAEVLHNLGKQWQFRVTLASPLILLGRLTFGMATPREAAIAATAIGFLIITAFVVEYVKCSRSNEFYRSPIGH